MRAKFLLFALSLAAISSCSTAYRTGQTPDDVYFSPARTYEENRKEDNSNEERRETAEDRVIRLGINDYRYRNLDYDYSYNPYVYGYDYGYYYNPYYYPYPVYNNPIVPAPAKPNTTPRKTDLSSYNNGYNNSNVKTTPKMGTITPTRVYNNNNTYNNTNNSNNSNNNTNNNTTRSYTPANNNNNSSSNTNTNSSSGNSSSGTPVSRPNRSSN